MNESKAVLTRHIGFRVDEKVFEQIQMQADQEGKPPNIWCRDRVMDAAQHPRITPGERALLDEIVATREITINLLYAMVTEGKPSEERFRQITGEAHAAKHREAGKLLETVVPKPEGNPRSVSNPHTRPSS